MLNLISNPKQYFWLWAGLTIIALSVTALIILQLSNTWLGGPLDFGVYLSSTKALLNQQNGWNAIQLNTIAHANGYLPLTRDVLGLWTPPFAMLILIPFTFLPYPIASWLWIAINELILCLGIYLLRTWLPTSRPIRLQASIGLFFPPLIVLLLWGQLTGLVLSGYILFVYFSRKHRDSLAGVSLLLTTFKPHLGYLVWIFLAWWIVRQRRWKIGLGLSGSLLATLAIVFVIHPTWLSDYQTAVASPPLIYNAASLFQTLHRVFFPTAPLVQFLGLAVSVIGLLMYLLVHRHASIDLLPTIPYLLLYSAVFAPYGWAYDQIVTLPIFLWLVHDFFRKHPAWWVWILVLIIYAAYYLQLADGWGNNDSRVFWFPLLLAIVWAFRTKGLTIKRYSLPHVD